MYAKFRDVKIGQAFDFASGSYEGNIKVSARKYLYADTGRYYETSVGTIDVEVTNIRDPHPWELEIAYTHK